MARVNVKSPTRPTTGYVDPATVTETGAPWRERWSKRAIAERQAMDASNSALIAERREMFNLTQAWERAEAGAPKRAALVALVAAERKYGYPPRTERKNAADMVAVNAEGSMGRKD